MCWIQNLLELNPFTACIYYILLGFFSAELLISTTKNSLIREAKEKYTCSNIYKWRSSMVAYIHKMRKRSSYDRTMIIMMTLSGIFATIFCISLLIYFLITKKAKVKDISFFVKRI
jgi:TctA family transporter